MSAIFAEPIEPRVYGKHLDGSTVVYQTRSDVDGWVLMVNVSARLQSGASYLFPSDLGVRVLSVRAAEPVMFAGETQVAMGQSVLEMLTPRQVRELEDGALRAAEGR